MKEIGNLHSGDVVRLRSGGPNMTLETASRALGVVVLKAIWFDGGELRKANFFASQLVKV